MEYDDIQGLVFSGYGTSMAAAAYHLLRVDDPTQAKVWLANLAPRVTPGLSPDAKQAVVGEEFCLNVAFTFEGLKKLLGAKLLPETFERAYQEGMTSPVRTRTLGDVGHSAPEGWDWGGTKTPQVDVLLLLYAKNEAAINDFDNRERATYEARGLSQVYPPIRATSLAASGDEAREHFGFADGISQPTPRLINSADDWKITRAKDPQAVPAGEFILGYNNAYYHETEIPQLASADAEEPKFGTNGTYLVLRQLQQDVHGFWKFFQELSARESQNAELLASKVVGRWPSGAPVQPGQTADPGQATNAFDYTNDKAGYGVPIGSHIRRSNPRSVGLAANPADSQEVADRHRILRRGRSYGTRVTDPSKEAPGERGLMFIGINANIERQFEFIMHSWMHNPLFGGLYQEIDPLVGDPSRIAAPPDGTTPTATTFTMPGIPVRKRAHNVPRFVTTRGGAYFFLPGLKALRKMASV